MTKNSIKMVSGVSIALFSLQLFAADTIAVTVKTDEKTAAAIGFSVDGKAKGRPGKSYTGSGPRDKEYVFGYRKSFRGADIKCGTLKLKDNSTVTLETKGDECHLVLK